MNPLSFLPAIVGVLGSIFKGKGKAPEYSAVQDPKTAAAYQALLKMLQSRMGQPSAGTAPTNQALDLIRNMFLGGQGVQGMPGMTRPQMPQMPMQQNPMGPGGSGLGAGGSIGPAIGSLEWLRSRRIPQ